MPLDPNQVEAIFSGALDKGCAEERECFLAEACAGDFALRKRVETLLQAHQDARHFLQELSPLAKPPADETLDMPHRDVAANAETLPPSEQPAVEDVPLPTIPGYEILGELGRGAMGVVYKARQLDLNRVVALKTLAAGSQAGVLNLVRFKSEAEFAARLQHPNIVQVFAVGKHEGQPFLSLEYVEGGTLAERLKGVPQLPQSAASMVETLARAVHHAHANGIIHRDVKPSNVLMTAGGNPKVADFGLAKQIESSAGMTQTGAILGTPSYMAPEQAASRKDVGPTADVYALGAILYEMITGRPPFQGPTAMDTVMQVLSHYPVSPRRLQPNVPRDLETICLKCLQKSPAQRYASAEALADDLKLFQEGRPIRARPVSGFERARRWGKRNPVVAGLMTVVACLLVAVAVVSTVSATQLQSALTKTQTAEEQARTAERQAKTSERQARLREAEALVGKAHGIRYSRRPGQWFDALAALKEAAAIGRELDQPNEWFDLLRNEAASALALPDVEVVREWELPNGLSDVTFDGTLQRYARSDAHGNVIVRKVADDGEIARLPGAGNAATVKLSPDGRLLAVCDVRTKQLKVWRLRASPALIHEVAGVVPHGSLETKPCVSFSADNQRLAYGRFADAQMDGGISVVTLSDGQVTRWPEKEPVGEPSFCPQGRRLMYKTWDNQKDTLHVRDVLTGAVQAELPHPTSISSYVWHPRGQLLATACYDKQIRIWNTATWGEPTLVLKGHQGFGITCLFTPEGDRLLSNGWGSLLRIWDVHSGRLLFTTPASYVMHSGPDGCIAVVGTGNNDAKVLRVAGGREFRTMPRRTAAGPGAYPADCVVLSPDGRFLAVPTEKGTCALVDPTSGAELAVIPLQHTQPFAFEASGAFLTSGPAGLFRWPVRTEPGTPHCRVGPPEPLLQSKRQDAHASSADGRIVAIPNYQNGALLLRRDQPGPPLVLGPQEDVRCCAVSPDGRWVATGNHSNTKGIEAKIWDTGGDRPVLVKDVTGSSGCGVRFSPDGKWLLISDSRKCRLWAVGTWEEKLALGPARDFAFSPDSRMLALGGEPGVIRLIDPASGQEYVRLDAPEQTRLSPRCFTPDGAQLIALGAESLALHVWDLRAIRRQLKTLNLDWDAPPYPEPEAKTVTTPLEVRVITSP